MGVDNGVVVDVDDARPRAELVRDLAHVALRGEPGSEIEELGNARLDDQVPHDPPQELAVGDGPEWCHGREPQDLSDKFAIGREVILPPEHRIVDAGDIRLADVEARVLLPTERIPFGHRWPPSRREKPTTREDSGSRFRHRPRAKCRFSNFSQRLPRLVIL